MVQHKAAPGSFDSADIVVEFFNPTIKNGSQNPGAGHYFLSANPVEAASIDAGGSGPGWKRTGRTFRAWNVQANAPANAVPVCRFYAALPNSHFYTANAAECQQLKDLNPTNDATLGWRFESIEFYTVVPQAGTCTGGFYPVYRSYNNRFSPEPAKNDGNHRITPSYIDYQRSIRFFGFLDEGIAFCAPGTIEAGGDLQTANVYPGQDVLTGTQIQAEYIYGNNGPGKGDGGTIYMALPVNVSDWAVTCEAKNFAVCPNSLDVTQLRLGQAVNTWPAGGVLTLKAVGTAPAVPAGGDATLTFATSTTRANGAPDSTGGNDSPPPAQTTVRSQQTCNYTLNPVTVSFNANGGSLPVSLVARAGCAWTATTDAPWVSFGTPSGNGNAALVVNAQANASPQARTGSVVVNGALVTVVQAGAVTVGGPACANLRLQREGDQGPATGLSGPTSVGVFADGQCGWIAAADAPWITLTSGAAGNGNGTIGYMTQPNPNNDSRTATINVGDKAFSVIQYGQATAQGQGGGSDGGGDSGGSSGGDSGGSSGGDSG
jgi:hypothetical protein